MATRVKIEGEGRDTIELEGTIESADAAAQRFVLRGATVSWDATTRFEDGTAADIAAGRKVKVKG